MPRGQIGVCFHHCCLHKAPEEDVTASRSQHASSQDSEARGMLGVTYTSGWTSP